VSLTPEQRSIRARIGGYALRAARDPDEYTAAGRATFLRGFLEAQPADLPTAERQRRAEAALRARMTALSLKASQSRTAKKRPTPAVQTSGAGTSEVRRDRDTST
jgi:hypothetical protein